MSEDDFDLLLRDSVMQVVLVNESGVSNLEAGDNGCLRTDDENETNFWGDYDEWVEPIDVAIMPFIRLPIDNRFMEVETLGH